MDAHDMNEPRAFLKAGREKALRRRHPWIFSGAIERVAGNPEPGTTVVVCSSAGEPLARAALSPRSQIRLRVWSFDDETIDADFFRARLEKAIALRRCLGLMQDDGACRLVFSEADGLPGLIVDRYRDHLVCQFLSAGTEYWRDTIVSVLDALLAPRCIAERSDAAVRRQEGLPSRTGILHGDGDDDGVAFLDHGVEFLVDVGGGHKTGAYLDQSVNRRRVAAYAAGARMLDAYCYAGGFSIAALKAGAATSLLMDSSADALAMAERHAARNAVAARCKYSNTSVPETLRQLRKAGEQFDLIVLDPPKFVQSAQQIQAGSRGYKDVNLLAMQLLSPGGILATFSCSGHVSADLFQKIVAGAALDAGREMQIIERLTQAPDHPVSVHFPEAEYLKGLILRASS